MINFIYEVIGGKAIPLASVVVINPISLIICSASIGS